MDSISSDPYSNLPLPSRGWFRLLTINPPDHVCSLISCTLQHSKIDNCPPYEAMSYTWGEEKATDTILVNGGRFALRPNLFSALKSLRKTDGPRTIWIDAICINQKDEWERNHQVWQMNNIYSHAAVVNVWLGNATSSSDTGIEFLNQFSSLLYHDEQAQLPILGSTVELLGSEASQHESRGTAVYPGTFEAYSDFYGPILSLLVDPQVVSNLNDSVALLARPWWKRMWTLQESILCPNVLCWCGSKTFPIEYLYYLSYFIYFSINFNIWKGAPIDTEVSVRAVWRAADLREHMASRKRIRLALALDSTWDRAASDKKDKVMGLLGLIGRRQDLEPEYSWPIEKIYRVAMRAALMEEQSLDCLSLMSETHASRNKNLNSWVPDFSVHDYPFSDNIASLSKPIFRRIVFNASLRDLGYKASIHTNEDDTILRLRGFFVDKVQNVGPKAPGPHSSDGTDIGLMEWENSMRMVLGEWRSLLPRTETYLNGESLVDAFWRTVLVDLKQGEHPKPPSAIGATRLDKDDIPRLGQLDTAEGIKQLLNTWSASMRPEYRKLRLIEQFNRRFIVTETGYIGLGPPEVQPGDSICILLGGSVPYALRQNTDGTWCYMGESYVHGIMDGEIVDSALKRKAEPVEFKIT
ncbi:heterokaryon incompatibility protein (het-6OR allele) [Fusarium heterosporum]|uniref:Heterokaryon incompatibility protein (Het-6OR allele) n=1 Tax=Fusarium heterosporum TaxID=42747 RepID=A0A8H5SZX5_FUSHE|nr:heterokaryon incompatibility protein (het-6OR allele) [Fusarium heterosporum]